ncbi:MAG TPA: Smr/MutS family protein [Castellaniella sp.]|uniref:Smr/MutS family protein n=1 Tax=Castellaniella sp. TaxID=1955812 RepID=UPI002F08DA4E
MKTSKATLADLRQLRAKAAQEPVTGGKDTTATRTSAKIRVQRSPANSAVQTGQAAGQRADAPRLPAAASLDPADRVLLEQAMRFVKPLARHGSRARTRLRREPEAILRMRRTQAQGEDASTQAPPPRSHRRIPTAMDPDAREFLQTGCGTDLLRGLRKGKWLPEAILDLHGSTEEQAHERLDRFIATCAEHDIRCVRIVHGKGIGSRDGTPVLKQAARIHLCRLLAVQAWVECAEPDGGAGAVTALLQPLSKPHIRNTHPA